MQKIIYHSMAERINEAVNCNTIYFQMEFSHAHVDYVNEAIIEFCKLITELHQSQFISLYHIQGSEKKCVTFSDDSIVLHVSQNQLPEDIVIDANVRSNQIVTKKEFKNFLHSIRLGKTRLVDHQFALNFYPYYEEKVAPFLSDYDKLNQAITMLLREEQMESINYCSRPDATGFFHSHIDFGSESYYSGSCRYSIMTECMDADSLNICAEYLVQGLKQICSRLETAGGRVGLCPFPLIAGNNPYMHYFGQGEPARTEEFNHSIPDHTFYRDWMKVYYCSGCDWANVLSSYAKKRLPSNTSGEIASAAGVQCEELSNSCVLIRSSKTLTNFNHYDLLRMKEFLYPSLFPGWRAFLISYPENRNLRVVWSIRSFWDCAPVLKDEFQIRNEWVYFKHQGANIQSGDGPKPLKKYPF